MAVFRRSLILALFCLPLAAQTPFPLQEIDEVNWVGSEASEREEADLGLAKASGWDWDNLLLEGLDDSARPWTVRLPRASGGSARTRVFRGDLDANGRDDLLLVTAGYGNGRCIDGGAITTLMFDSGGRPTPWQAPTVGLFPLEPAPYTILDLNADGRAEIVLTNCEYAEQMTERRWVAGIYEAEEGRWKPADPALFEQYREAAVGYLADRYRDEDFIHWREPETLAWPDLQANWDTPLDVTVDGLLSENFGCAPYTAEKLESDEPPCSHESKRSTVRYSDGKPRRGRGGWRDPHVVFDSPNLLDIRFDEDPGRMQHLLAAGYAFRAIGPEDEPTMLWIGEADDREPGPLKIKLSATFGRTIPIRLEAKPRQETGEGEPGIAFALGGLLFGTAPIVGASSVRIGPLRPPAEQPPPPPPGRYFGRQGRCFRFHGYDLDDLGWFEPVYNCAEPLPETADLSETDIFRHDGGFELLRVLSLDSRRFHTPGRPHDPRLAHIPVDDAVFEELPDSPGELVAAAGMDHDSYLTQWRLGTRTWLGMHDRDGKALYPPIEIDVEGEQFHVDDRRGFVFLVWEDDVPVEAKVLRGRFETVRAN